MPRGFLEHHTQGRVVREGRLVNASRAERVVDVCDSQNPGSQGDVVTGHLIGITLAIESFMMMSGDLYAHFEEGTRKSMPLGNFLQGLCADGRVRLHEEAFVGIELARL